MLTVVFLFLGLVLLFAFFIASLRLVIEETVCLLESFGLEIVLLEEFLVIDEEVETRAPLGVQVDATSIALVVGTRGQKNSQDSNDDDLWNRLVIVHMSLVE